MPIISPDGAQAARAFEQPKGESAEAAPQTKKSDPKSSGKAKPSGNPGSLEVDFDFDEWARNNPGFGLEQGGINTPDHQKDDPDFKNWMVTYGNAYF